MKVITLCAASVVLLHAIAPVSAQQKAPSEAQCREMVNGMLQSMKSTPMRTERDRQGAREVTDRAEKMVRDNRSRGASECDSWRAIGDLVTKN